MWFADWSLLLQLGLAFNKDSIAVQKREGKWWNPLIPLEPTKLGAMDSEAKLCLYSSCFACSISVTSTRHPFVRAASCSAVSTELLWASTGSSLGTVYCSRCETGVSQLPLWLGSLRNFRFSNELSTFFLIYREGVVIQWFQQNVSFEWGCDWKLLLFT